ncbi:Rrf2 family transcriptional regulator [Alkalihalobacillus deserti]|uniref:Rrf2 family transcriptional regulator n=1 Tax=Alkalihalobacillus deserti TaxID=2879466 RepID=UPI001D1396FD|nr:Rrf2 family transcriptional regulator [Alkalihalobacillus deserti]
MRLTIYTDYSLRVLIYLSTLSENEKTNIKEIATAYGISKNHLMKVIFQLGKLGLIETTRGRNGGIRLALEPNEINIGSVVRHTEDDLNIVECFNPEQNTCAISPVCKLKGVLDQALKAYLEVLDHYTLADLTKNQSLLKQLLQQNNSTSL